MGRGVRAAWVLAAGIGLLTSGCGGEHRDTSMAGGYAQPSSAAPKSSPPSTEAPESSPPSTEGPESPPPASTPPSTSTSAPEPSAGPLEIRTRETKYGRILVDGRGMTIYVSAKDNADFEPTCSGPCTKEWPPLFTNGQVTAGPGVNSAWLGTVGRADGPTQVEYNGWPLYYSARDTEPGDIRGQRVASNGTTWYVIDADKGQKVT